MTEQRPDFEDVPLVRLGRPADAQRAQAATILVVAILAILIVKPWGEPARPAAVPSPTGAASLPAHSIRPAVTIRPDGARIYDPGLFGRYTVPPRWELWPTAYVYQFGLSGPLAIDPAGFAPGGTGRPEQPAATPPPAAAQLVDVGEAGLLMVLGLNTPEGTRVLEARLWRFPSAGPPVRMALRELPPPWPVDTFHVYGLRVPNDSDPDLVADWEAGVYRLDLLVDPGAEIRRIGLLVRPSARDPGGPGRGTPEPTLASPTLAAPAPSLDDLPLPVTLDENQILLGTTAGPWLTLDPPAPQNCGLTELWLAESDRPGGPCWSIAASDVSLAAVDLGANRPIRHLSIEEIDPLTVMIDGRDRTDRSTGGGRIVATADGRPLGEGTYRLVATMEEGSELGWYFRVLPPGGSR
jgi:hypothetical protein